MNLDRPALVAAALALSPAAMADIETDRNVGVCVAYAMAVSKERAAEAALRMADKRQRAMQFARESLNRATSWRERGEWTGAVRDGWVFSGVNACHKVGIRVSDY